MNNISKVQHALDYFSQDSDVILTSNLKYVRINSVSRKYFEMSEFEFIKKYPSYSKKLKCGKYHIAPGNLIKCLESSEKGKVIADKINKMCNDEKKKIIGELCFEGQDFDGSVTIKTLMKEVMCDQDDEKDIEYDNVLIKRITVDSSDTFYFWTRCPYPLLVIFKKLDVKVYRIWPDKEYIIELSKYNEIFGHAHPPKIFNFSREGEKIDSYAEIMDNVVHNTVYKDPVGVMSFFFRKMMHDIKPPKYKDVSNKKLELLYYIHAEMYSNFSFSYNEKIFDYDVDCLIVLKGVDRGNIIKICLIINENNPEEENCIIDETEYYIYRINIDNFETADVKKIAKHESANMSELIRKSFIFSSPKLIIESIKKYVLKDNVHDKFVSLFFKDTSVGNPFIYSHEDVGNYLCFCSKENFRGLVELIKGHCEEKIDYIVINESGKHMYYISRLGFNNICSHAKTANALEIRKKFSHAYELTTQLGIVVISENSLSGVVVKNKLDGVNEELIEHINDEKDNEIITLRKENEDLKKKLDDVMSNIEKNEADKSVLIEKIKKLEKKSDTVNELLSQNKNLINENEKLSEENNFLVSENKEIKKTIKTEISNKKKVEKKLINLEAKIINLKNGTKASSKKSFKKVS